ncbi:MAG: plasmid pRiA4b ORF-3 family protein [Kiritimatiellae bacterium]|nr:plasmid pRiA4b ORF-3 family protein [Kiritimatiellia bacterium]
MKKEEMRELIHAFVLKQSDKFYFEKLLKHARRIDKGFDDEERLYELACESEWLFEDDRYIIDDCYMPRHCFFKGAEFRVTPLQEEVEGGFLIPGHRFIPFISREVFAGAVTLKLPDGSIASTRNASLPAELAISALMFYGTYGMISYLTDDNKLNDESFVAPYEQPVHLTVFEMQDFFKQSNFQTGDSLMLTVEDWLTGVLSCRHIPSEKRAVDFVGMREWVDALLAGFEKLREQDDLSYDCYEQAAHMFWLAETNEDLPSVIHNPPLSFAAFFNKQKELTIKTMGQLSFFWPIDEPIEERFRDLLEDDDSEPDSELEFMFQQLGVLVTLDDIEAYMRDALAQGDSAPLAALPRLINGVDFVFPNTLIKQEFFDLWCELWDEVNKRYVPEQDGYRELRAVFLSLNDRCIQVVRELGRKNADPFALRNKDLMQLGELVVMIQTVLVICNQSDASDADFPMPLDVMYHDISATIDALSECLRATIPDNKRINADGPVYQLKISLKESHPPIWRRVLVPANMQLEKLHDVIQPLFGWTNSHLHQFVDGDRTYYQPRGGDDDFAGMMRTEDSNDFRVCDLLCNEKDKIVYEYDFGDSWEHQIVLEKVLKPDPKKTLPICTKGMRAGPPEDCGGIYGYYQLLETLSGPDCPEKEELLEWLDGPIDPDDFDLKSANARLSAWF